MSEDFIDKRAHRIQRMFGQIAPRYDFLNHLLSLNIDKLWRQWTIDLLQPDLTNPAPILDVCTGTGDLILAYRKQIPASIATYGTDFCHEMLLRAVQKARKSRFETLFLEADTTNLPFPDNQFQIVSVAFGLRNVANLQAGMGEMIRVTQPGGKIGILEFSRPRGWPISRLYSLYFRHLLPRFGQLIAKNDESAYQYLPESVMNFPDGEEFCSHLRAHGLVGVRAYPFTFGIVTLYVGRKPGGEQSEQICESNCRNPNSEIESFIDPGSAR